MFVELIPLLNIKILILKPLLFILLPLVLLSSSCKKDRLPKFYFQCKVDGVLYEPDNCANCNSKELIGDTVLLLGANRGNEALSIGILKRNMAIGNYKLSSALTENNGSAIYDNTIGNPADIFRTDSTRTGVINITELDRSNRIIVGTFYFDAYNIPKNKILRVTEGKFRLNYRAY